MSSAVIALVAATLLYQNDFSTRTSAPDAAPGSSWEVYHYAPRVDLAYNFEQNSIAVSARYTKPYDWKPAQDGWTKSFTESRYLCNGFTTVTDEADPALVYTDKDVTIGSTATYATNHTITIMHPLRNVFSNGVLRLQFDVRQPMSYASNTLFTWLRLVEEYDMDLSKASNSEFPIEVGLSGNSLSGGWRVAGQEPGERTFSSSSSEGAGPTSPGHWYRYYVTYQLAPGDDGRVSFEAYDMGLSRLAMDEKPSGGPKWAKADLLFRQPICRDLVDKNGNVYGNTGGISGIMIRFYHIDTKGYYGEPTYEDDRAYKYDNIKVSWQKPGSEAFVDCYVNDFTTSRRRTIDGSTETTHVYEQKTVTETQTFDYEYATLKTSTLSNITSTSNTPENEQKNETDSYAYIRKASSHKSSASTPYLAGYSSNRANQPQATGVDGWRVAGHSSYTAAPYVIREQGNLMLYSPSFSMAKQLMCEEIRSGIVKFEFDQRMPTGWTGTPRCDICLMSQDRFENGYNNSSDPLLRVGLSAHDSTVGSKNPIRKAWGIFITGTYKSNVSSWIKPLHWYRFQAIINLDTKRYDLNVYDLGTAAPANPDDFVTSDSNRFTWYSNYALEGSFQNGIAAWGYTNYLDSRDPVKDKDGNDVPQDEVRALIDNVRLWKKNGEDWNLVFQNTFKESKRTFTAKKGVLNPTAFIDRPEYGEDRWASCPTYASTVPITGNDSVLQFRGDYYSVVHSLGRNIRSGNLTFQYDVRLPTDWTYDKLQIELGGATLASASTAAEPYRFNLHSSIRTGFSRSGLTSFGGYYAKSYCYYDRGPGTTGYVAQQIPTVWGDEHLTNARWYRVKVSADVSSKTFDIAYYDMGTTHPTVSTPEGTLITEYKNAKFRYSDEPISHLWIFGGKTWSYAPWRDDAPGALLIDNIKVCHDKKGLAILVR